MNVPPITIPNFRPKCSKSIPVFRPKRLKNHTLWAAHTYIPYIGEYPPLDLELYPIYNFRLTAEEKEKEAVAAAKLVKVEVKKQPKPVKKPGETFKIVLRSKFYPLIF